MKKLILFVFALALGLGVKAQCPLTTAVDFTATDCHGTEVNLFEILDSGQAVLIDFFFTTCGPCQQATPKVVESYYAMGCNMHDVFYMEISPSDADAACQNWANNYGVEYPTIGTTGGGSTICNTYQIGAYPTLILIMPDHQIVIQDLWPISNAQTVVDALVAQGVQPHDCNAPTYDPQVSVIVNEVTETSANVTFIPNEDCTTYYYQVYTETEMQAWISTMGISAGEVLQNYGFMATEETTHDFDGLLPGDTYFVWVVPADIDGNLYEVQQEELVETPIPPDIMADFTGIDIDGNEINLYSILDGGQTVLINLFLTDDASAQIMPYVVESYRLFGCNDHDVYFMEICPQREDEDCRNWAEFYGVKYPTISRTGGGNDIAQSIPVAYYPTVMIINPDHSIAYRDLYPIEDTQTIVNALEGVGCEQHDCLDETLTFSPNTVDVEPLQVAWVTVINNTSEDAIVNNVRDEFGLLFTLDGQTMYGNYAPYEPLEFTIPQGGSIELGLYLDEIAKDIISDVVTLSSNLPDASFIALINRPESVDESKVSISLFPNPANESITLKGVNLGQVHIFNTLGQEVESIKVPGIELTINTSRYENGVYVIKTDNGTTARFVVKH